MLYFLGQTLTSCHIAGLVSEGNYIEVPGIAQQWLSHG